LPLEVAKILRSQSFDSIDYQDELLVEYLKASSLCEPEIGFNGVSGFIYQSVIDAIKDTRLKRKDRNRLMAIGRLQYLKDEDFNKIGADDTNIDDKINQVFGASALLQKTTK